MTGLKKIKWGIIGPGRIAEKFAGDLSLIDDAVLSSVASRSPDRAASFAARHPVGSVYPDYETMIREGDTDIMYIATPHTFHLKQALMCLENGIAVLCEKPAGINRREVQLMVDAARLNQVFFMEALWTRFLPSMQKVLEIVESGSMGEVEQVEAEFCFTAPVDLSGRLYDLALGGGAILDIGIYPAFLAYQLLGKPQSIQASAQLHETGADQSCTMNFEYGDRKSAALHCSILIDSNMPARITLSKGYILMQPRWHASPALVVLKAGYDAEHIECPPIGKGFSHEIMESHRCLRENRIESQLWSHRNSLDLMEMLDEVRRQSGVVYPGRD